MTILFRKFDPAPLDAPRLPLDLIPRSSGLSDIQHKVSRTQWNHVKNQTFEKAGHRCEICNGRGPTHPVECHEKWALSEDPHSQKLLGMVSLCPKCHEVKHITQAEENGRYEEVLYHLAWVNGWDTITATEYLMDAYNQQDYRSEFEWKIDISILPRLILPHEEGRKRRVEEIIRSGDIF